MKFSKAEIEAIIAASTRKFVPFNKLVLSKDYQARTACSAPKLTITELAASIQGVGVLQNLIVVKGPRGVHEVCAGGRRLEALELLVLNGIIPENWPVPVLVVAADCALIASIAENCFHVQMHPADEYTAFAKLVAQGRSIEDVAAAFGVTPLVVKRRMKLGSVSPKLMSEYRQGKIALDCLMVLASVDEHQRQESAWAAVPPWNQRPDFLRQLLTQGEVESDRDPIAKFVTLKAYEKAGGSSRRDLFSDSDKKAYLLDIPLLERLALDKLQRRVKPLLAEGWKWVDVRVHFDRDEYLQHGELRRSARSQTAEEAKEIAEIENRLATLSGLFGWSDDDDEDDQGELAGEEAQEAEVGSTYEDMEEEAEKLRARHNVLLEGLYGWPTDLMPQAGCVLFVGPDGEPTIKHGLIRPEDKQEVRQAVEQVNSDGGQELLACQPGAAPRAVHSERLMRRLTAHRVAAIQASLTQQPQVALAAFTAQLATKAFERGYSSFSNREVFNAWATCNHHELSQAAEDLGSAPAWTQVQAQREAWQAQLPERADEYFPWLLTQPPGVVLKLLTFLIAVTVKGVYGSEQEMQCNDALAQALRLDMNQWWSVTGESYLNHVSKSRIVEVVAEAVDAGTANTLQPMKKGEAVETGERLLTGKGWLPNALRLASTRTTEPAGDVNGESLVQPAQDEALAA